MSSLLLGLLVVAAIGVAAWFWIGRSSGGPAEFTTLLDGSQPGNKEVTSSTMVPRSNNQPEGIVFTYTGWLLINDFTINYGARRRVFSKGDCPGLYIDGTSNSLIVAVNTYGNKETILVPNIPAKKWIHFAMTVNQYAVDIYINGTLRMHHTLNQLPKQNDDPVVMGSTWEGVMARLHYYPRSLSMSEVDALSREKAPDDLYKAPAAPQYLDMSWYVGRVGAT